MLGPLWDSLSVLAVVRCLRAALHLVYAVAHLAPAFVHLALAAAHLPLAVEHLALSIVEHFPQCVRVLCSTQSGRRVRPGAADPQQNQEIRR